MELKHSVVMRGGVTAKRWYGATSDIQFFADETALQFRFVLPSKGGGETSVMVRIGANDWPALIRKLSKEQPALAESFAEATLTSLRRRDAA